MYQIQCKLITMLVYLGTTAIQYAQEDQRWLHRQALCVASVTTNKQPGLSVCLTNEIIFRQGKLYRTGVFADFIVFCPKQTGASFSRIFFADFSASAWLALYFFGQRCSRMAYDSSALVVGGEHEASS